MENNNIYKPNEDFNFDQFTLCSPNSLQNNSYFTKILFNNSSLYIETPKSISKQGFIINGKKMYCDLMFDNNDKELIHWIELLELKCHNLICEKSESWFENKLLLYEVESVFSSPLKIYKAGKNYLLRVNIKMNYTTNLPSIKIYNENETSVSFDEINANTTMISILEVQGIKFTSKNFQIEFVLKQIMVLDVDKIFEKCLIKTNALNKLTASLETNKLVEEKEIQVIKL